MITLGDPHLGRTFKTGVPLDRRGEREASMWEDFQKSLWEHNSDVHVNMGDLYDKFVVSPEIVLQSAKLYLAAAQEHKNCQFYVLRGNHDVSRDTNKSSSFDIFKMLVSHQPNIKAVDEPFIRDDQAFIPYNPFIPLVDTINDLPDGLDLLFMHHDYADWGGDQVIPTELLFQKNILKVINGHDHLARTEKRHGVEVVMTGSMQPYTHSEDPEGDLYRTVTLEELMELETSNLNVRVLLQEGEELPADLDCLSLTAKRITAEETSVETEEFDNFDLKVALADAVHPLVKDAIMEQFDA